MVKKIKLADVLWEAANKHLSPVYGISSAVLEEYSCHAAYRAAYGSQWRRRNQSAVDGFLTALGCDVSWAGFGDYGSTDVQGVRYMWLLLAMHVAEDEGIEIEVTV